MARTSTYAALDVPPIILEALLLAADEIVSDWLLTKWSQPAAPAPNWQALEECRAAFGCYPWPTVIGGG